MLILTCADLDRPLLRFRGSVPVGTFCRDVDRLLNLHLFILRLPSVAAAGAVIPDPTDIASYHRYMYGLGNPVKFNDPSGNIAIVFQGGENNAVAETSVGEHDVNFRQLSRQALLLAGYDDDLHGSIHYLTNGDPAIDFAHVSIYEAKMLNPDEPVLLLGYSWGGAAALEVANRLNDAPKPIGVDPLLTIDPDNDMRGFLGRVFSRVVRHPVTNTHRARMRVPGNVSSAINIYAINAQSGIVNPGIPAWNWTWGNGMNYLSGATNIGIGSDLAGKRVDHYSIISRGPALNHYTMRHMIDAISSVLY